MSRVKTYSQKEELANSLSHALGILVGIVGGYYLLSKAAAIRDPWAVGSVLVYLFGMLSSYITSTIYHGLANGKRKQLFRKLDHSAIFFHIAGTYTPFTLVTLREEGAWGWSLFAFVWLAAIIGTYTSCTNLKEHSNIKTVCYVVMGSSIFVAFKPLIDVLGAADKMDALYWLIAGGVSYLVGAIFYSLTKVKYMHTVFHLFVLGGSVCHIIAIYIAL